MELEGKDHSDQLPQKVILGKNVDGQQDRLSISSHTPAACDFLGGI